VEDTGSGLVIHGEGLFGYRPEEPRESIVQLNAGNSGSTIRMLSGLLAGSMTDPPALAFASNIAGTDAPTIAYATVYPLTTLLRILSAQVLAIVLFR
jgi:hypothetical protein